MKSYSQRQNQRLLREFVGPQGQIDPMAMPGQQQNPGQQPNPMGMNPAAGQMGQQPNPMGMNPAAGQMGQMGDMSGAMGGQQQQMPDMGNPMGMNPAPGEMGDMSGAMGGGQDMGDMSGAMGGQEETPAAPAADALPSQLNAALRFMSGKSAQQIMTFQKQFNQAVQKMLTSKSKASGKKNLWQQFQAHKDAKANWGKPEDATAP